MRRRLQPLGAALLGLLMLVTAPPSVAHELTLSELHLRELAHGEFLWSWGAGGLGRLPEDELSPVWPERCSTEGDRLSCDGGLTGTLGINGIGESYSATMVRITWLDGQRRVYTITTGQPSVRLYGAADDARGSAEIVTAYTILGVEHILGGIDHLLFVICLLFLVGFNRRLVWTITAFTAAHSLTLIGSTLGWLTLRSGPVEAVIALSILLMAVEAARRDETLTRRFPAIVAFAFGLIHGLGFAGALTDVGLPEQHLLLALLTFNIGVELGQLLVVVVAWGLVALIGQRVWAQRTVMPTLYVIGALAAFWTWERVSSLFVI